MLQPFFSKGQTLAAEDLNALVHFADSQATNCRGQFSNVTVGSVNNSIPRSLLMPAEFLQNNRFLASAWPESITKSGALFAAESGYISLPDDDLLYSPRKPGTMDFVAVDETAASEGDLYLVQHILTDAYGKITDHELLSTAQVPDNIWWVPPSRSLQQGRLGHIYVPLARLTNNELLNTDNTVKWSPASKMVARNFHPITLPPRIYNAQPPLTDVETGSSDEQLGISATVGLVGDEEGRSTPVFPLAAMGGLKLKKIDIDPSTDNNFRQCAVGLASFVIPQNAPDAGWGCVTPDTEETEPTLNTWITVATLKIRANVPIEDGGPDNCADAIFTTNLQCYQAAGHKLAFRFFPDLIDLTSPPTDDSQST